MVLMSGWIAADVLDQDAKSASQELVQPAELAAS